MAPPSEHPRSGTPAAPPDADATGADKSGTDVSRAGRCPRCGALNDVGFGRCIRCKAPLRAVAQVADRATQRLPTRAMLGTIAMAALCLLVFAGQTIGGLARGVPPSILPVDNAEQADAIRYAEQVEAIRFGAAYIVPELIAKEPWRLLSAAFVHFGILHIFLNLLALRHLSRVAEPAVGPARYVIAYVASALVSFSTTTLVVLITGQPAFTAGASGAVFGIMGLILGFMVRRRDSRWKAFAMQAVVLSVMFGFAVNASGSGIAVNNSAHLGGLACGFVFGWVYGKPRRPPTTMRRGEFWVNLAAALSIAACLASLVLAQISPLWREFERMWLG